MIKKIVVFCMVVAFLLFVIAGLYFRNKKSVYSGPVDKVTFGISATAPELSTLILIAKDKEFFKINGIDAQIKTGETAVNVVKDLDSGVVDMGTLSDFVYVSNSFSSPDNFSILSSINKAGFLELVARKDAGIYTPGDLKGKKIGVTLKTSAEFYLGRFLTLNNLSIKDVTVVPIGPTDVVAALQNGTIDATSMGEPQVSQLKKTLGQNAISWSMQGDDKFYWILVAKKALTQTRPEVIIRVLNALSSAERFVKKSPDQAQKIVATVGNRDLDYITSTWSKHNFALSLPQSVILTMEDEARWKKENDSSIKKPVPNYLDFVYFDALQRVAPEAVTIIH